MLQVEAVMKMLQPGYDVRPIAVRRRKLNPWFKRGTVFRAALDVLRTAEGCVQRGRLSGGCWRPRAWRTRPTRLCGT